MLAMSDRYGESFERLESYVQERSWQEAMAELGGNGRALPVLDGVVMESCHVSHYLSNDLEEKWVRAVHLGFSADQPPTILHNHFRNIASDELIITYASDEETFLCTEYSWEVVKVSTFEKAGETQLFVSSQLSGFDEHEARAFLIDPLGDLTAQSDLVTRAVGIRSSRVEGGKMKRMLEQWWHSAEIPTALQTIVSNVDGARWIVESPPDIGELQAAVRHVASADLIQFDRAMRYGQLGLRARLL